MRTKFFPIICLLTIGILALSSCNIPDNSAPAGTETPTEPPAILATATIELTATQAPTETPAATVTETFTPEPSATATPEVVTAKVGRESNCRIGPGGIYDLVATYQADQMLEVVARDLGGGYVFVRNPDKPEEQCYILENNVTIGGDKSILPQFTPLPSPTAVPYFNVSFKKFDICKGVDFAIFNVENVGSVPFRSAYIRITDAKADKSAELSLSAFDLMTGCIVAKNIAPLEAGGTGFVNSAPLKWPARQNTLQAVIMLCTEKSLKGTCVTRVIEVKD